MDEGLGYPFRLETEAMANEPVHQAAARARLTPAIPSVKGFSSRA
jgi:hypothetical protein